MTLYHVALGVLYVMLGALFVVSLASSMLSSQISRHDDRGDDATPGR
tara:strand:+ start:380 stop:520 length:141 start_codon:yes stop_codon:yes gene_type:complete